VRTNRQLADQHIVWLEAGGDRFGDAGWESGVPFYGRDRNIRVEPFPILSAPVDAIQKVKVERLRAQDGGSVSIFLPPPLDRRFCRGETPHKMLHLGQGRNIIAYLRVTAHEGPDFNWNARPGLVVDQAACREYGIIKVRGKVYPSHVADLTTVNH
jgi:hypothetical protein